MGQVTPQRLPAISAPRPIAADDHTADFSCGKPPLDEWLKNRALRAEGRSARTYVVCEGAVVVAYCCFAAGAVRLAEVPRPIRRNMPTDVPVILLGRLAVDKRYQGRGIGSALLKDAFARGLEASAIIGARAVLVHALDEEAAAFYSAYGFMRFPETGLTLFLPMETIRAAIEG